MEYTAVKFFIGLLFAWIAYFNVYPSIMLCLVVFYASWHATRCCINFIEGGA